MHPSRRTLLRGAAALSAGALLARLPGARLVQAQAAAYQVLLLPGFDKTMKTPTGVRPSQLTSIGNAEEGPVFLVGGGVVVSDQKMQPRIWLMPFGEVKDLGAGKYGGMVHAVGSQNRQVGVLYRDPPADPNVRHRPVLWTGDQREDLPRPADVPKEGWDARPRGINDEGVVVGYTILSDKIAPVRWSGGGAELLPAPDDAQLTFAQVINASGTVGGVTLQGERLSVAVWEGDELALFDTPEGTQSALCYAIAEDGRLLVTVEFEESSAAYVYEGGKPTRIEGLNRASGMNADGVVVGQITREHSAGFEHLAAIWADGEARLLNDMIPDDSGLKLTDAVGINGDGAIAVLGKDADDATVGALLVPVG